MTNINTKGNTSSMAKPSNFCYPLRPLSNDNISLVPFDPSTHLAPYFALSSPYPELYKHTTFGPFGSAQEFYEDFVAYKIENPTTVMFAVVDKTRSPSIRGMGGALAGIIGYLNSEPANLSTEIGFVFTLPGFQKRRVASTAVGLMLWYALEPVARGGLGLRRVQWQTNSSNQPSRRLAEKMGFRFEGILRWQRIFHGGKRKGKMGNGKGTPLGGDGEDLGRDTVMLGICWDDWEHGARERVQGLIKEPSSRA
ncbi:hypothetical protein GJ744_001440 [Endocarpon pusillum]|uniref:N-acetyltransferase domain-containing protein n=1 Tax=Endocarpon pusillum TaxID=364733 RepID=A0A8H7ANJ2_9EURO|nr:hypothetical protein GJ744_001440 [Endocarpon pusillum]